MSSRRFPFFRPWVVLAAIVAAAAGAGALAVAHARAAGPVLWNEGRQVVPAPTLNWVAVAKQAKPAVVNISTTQVVRNPLAGEGAGRAEGPERFQDFFRHFFGDQPRDFRTRSLGSGFVIREDGYIVTNNHVVDGATEITVKLSDGRHFGAKVVGRDPKTDVALLKIEARGLPTIPFGDSDRLEVGEPVMAIGNPFGLDGTVTTGIVSAKGRVIGQGPYDDFIQTDASINPGNSGGPLVNPAGEVVGINTAIFSSSGGSVGIGFAIPVNESKVILPQLEANGHVTRGWLGVSVQPVTPDLAKVFNLSGGKGALVADVMKESPAAQAGIQAGDVIVEYDGHAVARVSDLPHFVAETPLGKQVFLKALREGRPVTVTAKIAEMREPQAVASVEGGSGSLGLRIQPLTPGLARELGVRDRAGVVVAEVQDGGPAALAGVHAGDVIVQANRKPVHSVADLQRALRAQQAGAPTLLQIHRKDSSLFVAVKATG